MQRQLQAEVVKLGTQPALRAPVAQQIQRLGQQQPRGPGRHRVGLRLGRRFRRHLGRQVRRQRRHRLGQLGQRHRQHQPDQRGRTRPERRQQRRRRIDPVAQRCGQRTLLHRHRRRQPGLQPRQILAAQGVVRPAPLQPLHTRLRDRRHHRCGHRAVAGLAQGLAAAVLADLVRQRLEAGRLAQAQEKIGTQPAQHLTLLRSAAADPGARQRLHQLGPVQALRPGGRVDQQGLRHRSGLGREAGQRQIGRLDRLLTALPCRLQPLDLTEFAPRAGGGGAGLRPGLQRMAPGRQIRHTCAPEPARQAASRRWRLVQRGLQPVGQSLVLAQLPGRRLARLQQVLPHLLRLRPHALEREAPAAPVLPEPGLDLIAPALGTLLQQHLVGPHRGLDAAAVEALVHAQREQPAQLRRLPDRLALLHQPLVVERQPLPHRAGLGCAQRQAALIRQHRQIGQHHGGRRRITRQTLAQQPQQLAQQHLGQMRAHRGKISAALAQRPAAQPAGGRRHRIDGIRRIGQVGRVGLQRQTLQQPGGHRLRIGLTGRRHPADQAACQRQPVSTGDPVEMQLDLQPGLARAPAPPGGAARAPAGSAGRTHRYQGGLVAWHTTLLSRCVMFMTATHQRCRAPRTSGTTRHLLAI